jgi:two-component system cell cycle sensor histidine kinase/response regulator CckA
METRFTKRQVTPMSDSSDDAGTEKLEAFGTVPNIPDEDGFKLMMDHKRSVVKASLFIGMPLFLVMAIKNFIKGDNIMAFLNCMTLLILILLGFVIMRRIGEKSEYKIYSILFRLFFAVMGISLFYDIGFQSNFSRIEWCYIYPVLVFLAIGVKEGVIWVFIFYGILAFFILNFDLQGINLFQIQELRSRFLVSFFAVCILSLFLEYGFRRAQQRLLHHQRILKESENRYHQAYDQLNTEVQERKQAEEALLNAAKQWRTTFDSINDFVCLLDLEGKILRCNKAMKNFLGKSFNEIINYSYCEIILGTKTPNENCPFLRMKERLRRENTILSMNDQWYNIIIDPILDESGYLIGAVSIISDITERKQAEEEVKRLSQENAIMAEIGQIISSTLNIEDVYEQFVEKVCEVIPSNRIGINIINPRDNIVTTVYAMGLGVPDRLKSETNRSIGTFTKELMHTRTSMLIQTEDLKKVTDRFPGLLPIFQAGIRSLMAIPLISKDEVIAILHLQSTKPNAYSERDFNLAEKVGNQIAGAIANARLFAERRQAEEALSIEKQRFQTVSENAPFGIALIDKAGIYKYINPKFRELFGYDLNDIPDGKAWFRKAYPDPTYRHHAISTWITDNNLGSSKPGEKISRTFTVTCKDGTEKIINIFPVKLETGEYLTSFVDFTLHKKAEETLRRSEEEAKRLAQENAVMAEIGRIISSSLDINEVYGPFAKKVREIIPFDRITIHTINLRDNSMQTAYATGLNVAYRLKQSTVSLPGTSAEEIIRTRTPMLTLLEDPKKVTDTFPHLLSNFQAGIRSLIGIPLISKNEVIGILHLQSTKLDAYFDKDLRLAERVGDQIAGAIANAQLFNERKRAKEALRESDERYRTILESIDVGFFENDLAGNFTFVNDVSCRRLGHSREELIGMNNRQVTDEATAKKMYEFYSTLYRTGNPIKGLEMEVIRKDGTKIIYDISASLIRDSEGKPTGFRGISRDITERKQAEEERAALQEQLRQSQKMEAVGKLAGGIAHDFNNLLTVITGYSDLILRGLDPNDPIKGDIEEIKMSAEKAASLTQQLLAFSRKQVLQPKVLDLNAHVSSMDKMLRRMIGEDIELVTLLAKDLGRIKADPGQIEQVILNLAINAKYAMPNGGKLTIETANMILDENYSHSRIGVTPGHYVMLSVSDNGVGMTPEIKDRIFEPFFTTKEKGKGTGLGLSTVYGIIQQSGGNIWVYSEPGVGTTFKIYLPMIEEGTESLRPTSVLTKSIQGFETILLVEDEEMVRKLARTVLQKNGYTVLEASNGEEALRMVQEQNGDPIHLVVTDVVMPGMSGRQLAERLVSLWPEMKVLYMSGYTDDAIVHHGVLTAGIAYIQKPFSPDALVFKVREVLDGN